MPRPRIAQPLFHNRDESVSALPPPPTHSAEEAEKELNQPDKEGSYSIITEASYDELTPTTRTKSGRRRPIMRIIYMDEQEMDLAKWFRDNPIFYDKRRRDYRDAAKKAAMYDLKGKSMNPPVAGTQVKSWLDSMRTRFGRISERKSGQDTPKFTERDIWILNTFAFLKGHIVRQNGRQKSQHSVGIRTHIPVTSKEDGDVEMVDRKPPLTTFAASTSQMKKKRHRIQEEEDIGDLLQKLQERSVGNEQVMSTVTRQLQPQSRHEAEIQSLMTFVTQQLMGVDPSLIDDVTDTFTQVTRHFRKETRRIQEEREQEALLLS